MMFMILTRRLKNKAEQYIGKYQFSYRTGRGTRETIGVLRIMGESTGT